MPLPPGWRPAALRNTAYNTLPLCPFIFPLMDAQTPTLHNRRILLGVSGGIAAYKSAELVRLLRTAGAEVRVVMSPAATEFITPLTMQALSGQPVHTGLLDTGAEAAMGHSELARWADLVLVAPATADFLARLAAGRADELLSAVCLASAAPLAVAPAMNQQMWRDAATQQNCRILEERKVRLWGPATGEQACGDTGPGRMLEAAQLRDAVTACFNTRLLEGVRILVSAGPTHEALDPVRYLGNRSSGRMGFALAEAGVDAGAQVTLVAGPCALPTPEHVRRIDVRSALQMREALLQHIADCEVFIAAAAVADYRPAREAPQKIRSGQKKLRIELVQNPDILAEVAALDAAPFTVGFAAETAAHLQGARDKLQNKGVDLMIVNDVSRTDIGFDSPDNELSILWRDGRRDLPKSSKQQLAVRILETIAELRPASP